MKQDRAKLLPHIMFGFFALFIIVYAAFNHWPGWVIETVILGYAISVAVYMIPDIWEKFGKIVFAVCVWMDITVYTMYGRSFVNILTATAVAVVVLSLYDLLIINYLSVVATVLLIFLNIIFFHPYETSDFKIICLNCLQYFSLFIVEWVEIKMLKARLEYDSNLEKSIQEQKRAEQGKDDFMANISHEIRTPLHVISGTFERLFDLHFDAETQSAVENAAIAGKELRNLVDNILDFSELQNDTMEITNESYELASVINDAVNVFQAWNESKKLELIVDCQADIPYKLMGDSQGIYRALLHVLNNAFKFTEHGGVTLRVSCRRESYGVNILFNIEDTGIGIKDEDIENLARVYNQVDTKRDRQNTGIGIGIAITKKLIEKMNGFFHIESRYGEGTRVTISIPQKVVDDRSMVSFNNNKDISILLYLNQEKYYNAQIRDSYSLLVENITKQLKLSVYKCNSQSEMERRASSSLATHIMTAYDEYCGARHFYDSMAKKSQVIVIANSYDDISKISEGVKILYKPFQVFSFVAMLNDDNHSSDVKERWNIKDEVHVEGSKILVVDDSPMNLKVVEFLLKKYGIDVDKAISGKEGIEYVKNNKYDLIFMDHMMPEMDGVECFHNIRNLGGDYPKLVPIVALTANSVSGAREMMLNEGFNDFVAKPLDKSNLERVLKKFIMDKENLKYKTDEIVTDKVVEKTSVLPTVDGFDWDIALENFGGEKRLIEEIKSFTHSAPALMNQLDEFLKIAIEETEVEKQNNNIDSYKMAIHSAGEALKSIGNAKLSGEFASQEALCEQYDIPKIKGTHRALMVKLKIGYAKLGKAIK